MDSPSSVLLLEDDPAQRLLLAAYLRQAGLQVNEADSLAQARTLIGEYLPRLALLDLNLPDGDGFDLLRELLQRGIPVIVVTCRPEDRIPALEIGADDFLDKPYHPRELLARVHNVLRRCKDLTPQSVRLGSFHLDLEGRSLVDAHGEEVGLTRGEFDLLAALVEGRGRVVGRADLSELVSPDGAGTCGRSVDVLVSRLRHKLEADPKNPRLLLTAPGIGYRLRL